jgi:hypothetical protein
LPLVVLNIGLLVIIHHCILTSSNRYANEDFMALWCGGRAVLEGIDPYDPSAWPALRARSGSMWMPNLRLPYPIWIAWLMVPFAALDLDWAAACWLVCCELLVGACCLALLTRFGAHKPARLKFEPVVPGAFAFRGTMTNLINLGMVGGDTWTMWILGTGVLPWALCWGAIRRERDTISLLVPLVVSATLALFVWIERWPERRISGVVQ